MGSYFFYNTMLSLFKRHFFYNFFLRDLITGFYSANCLTLFVLEFISSIRRLTQRRNALIIGRTGMKRQIFEIKE